MKTAAKLLVLVCLFGLIFSHPSLGNFLKTQAKAKHNKPHVHHKDLNPPPNDYNTGYYNQTLDHFHYGISNNQSMQWSQRYLYNASNWGGNKTNSPILFYCGNEASVTTYWQWDRFIIDVLAPELGGYLLFMEHRYFGVSMPFGNDSFTDENLVYLTTDQALSDYAVFIQWYKKEVLFCPSCPVIVFGGSYGGMLASWMRMKFPNVVDGAIAGSAPIRMFERVEDPELAYSIITWDFGNSTTPSCGPVSAEGFKRLTKYQHEKNGTQYQLVNAAFNACKNITSNEEIAYASSYVSNAYFTIAELDYPFPCDYVTPMPMWPVNYACQAFTGLTVNSSDEEIFSAMNKASNIFYDYYNTTNCSHLRNPNQGDLAGLGWPVLSCSEMSLIMPNNGVDDFFPPGPFNRSVNNEQCREQFGLEPRYAWALDFFGGWTLDEYESYSNIFFSNGQLDPWRGGGVLQNVSSSLISFVIELGAHHLDLYGPTPNDPPSVIQARQMETNYIKQWIHQKQKSVQARENRDIEA